MVICTMKESNFLFSFQPLKKEKRKNQFFYKRPYTFMENVNNVNFRYRMERKNEIMKVN